MSRTNTWTWRLARLLAFLVPIYIAWGFIPVPELIHTQEWLDAQAKKVEYQVSLEDQAGIQNICDQATVLTEEACTVLSSISDPLERLQKYAFYDEELTRINSRHPLFPSTLQNQSMLIREAAGIVGVIDMDPALISTIQSHPELLAAGQELSEQLQQEYGIGFDESFGLTFPYYSLLVLRFLFLLFFGGWCSTLVTALMLKEKGFNPVAVAQRELGSLWAILFVAPISNAFLGDFYEQMEYEYSDCRYPKIVAGEIQVTRQSIHTKNFIQLLYMMLEPIWKAISWKDPLRLSLKFRMAIVTSLAMIINVAVVTGARAGTIEEYVYIGDNTTYSTRVLWPDSHQGTWQLDWDLVSDNDSFTFGYRYQWQDLGSDTMLQPRTLFVSNDGDVVAGKIQALVVGTANDHPWSFFTSLKIPDGRASIYNELAFDLNPEESTTLRIVAVEFNALGDSANWRVGLELQRAFGDFTVKVRQGLGIGGMPNEFQASVCFPF